MPLVPSIVDAPHRGSRVVRHHLKRTCELIFPGADWITVTALQGQHLEETMAVIAITREIGTRGMDVAVELGERLQLDVINDELIEHDVAMRTGVAEQTVHRIFDGTATLLERWRMDNQRLSESTAEKIYQLASKGNVVLRAAGVHRICCATCRMSCAFASARPCPCEKRCLSSAVSPPIPLRRDAGSSAKMPPTTTSCESCSAAMARTHRIIRSSSIPRD